MQSKRSGVIEKIFVPASAGASEFYYCGERNKINADCRGGLNQTIFVSFSGEDTDLSDALVRLLKEGADFRESDIFSFRKPGNLIPGRDFIPVIREKLALCDKVILLITKNYLNSYFCLAELGAAWALEKDCLIMISDSVPFDILNRTPLLGKQAISISDTTGLAVWLNDQLNSWQMEQYQRCAGQYRLEVERVNRFLPPDEDGIHHAEIKSVYSSPPHRFYRLDRLIDLDRLPQKVYVDQYEHQYHPDESHWVADWKSQFPVQKKGDIIAFRVLSVSGENNYPHVDHARNLKIVPVDWD